MVPRLSQFVVIHVENYLSKCLNHLKIENKCIIGQSVKNSQWSEMIISNYLIVISIYVTLIG